MTKNLLVLLFGLVFGFLLASLSNNYLFKEKVVIGLLPDGGEYTGKLVNGKLEGQGEIHWGNGGYYTGTFREGLSEGLGILQFANGGQYKGQFIKGLMNGSGEYSDDVAQYKGEFKDDEYHGFGVYTLASGDIYSGQFKQGEFHGNGEYRTSDNDVYTGEFVDGNFTGVGSYTSNDGSRYVGQFVDWVYSGDGLLISDDGGQYSGKFSAGSLNGDGEYLGDDGAQYTGAFKYNYYHGNGELITAEGDVYKGQFRYGKYHGQGSLTYKEARDGVKALAGRWRDGELIEPDKGIDYKTAPMLTEQVLYNQQQLLETSIARLEPNIESEIDLYFFGVAGHGSEAVFRREMLFSKTYFDNQLGTAGKSLVLVNSRQSTDDYPLATQTSIERSLNAIAAKMDAEQDILFIYLTSHGSKNFEFSIDQPGLSLNDLPAPKLAELVDNLPVRWKVVVVSSCYSGGHIDHLANDTTLVITASAADKKSFGCDDNNDFTYFGEAFFKDALPVSQSFVDAFDKAYEIVKQRESEQGYTLSDPQISKPAAVVEHLAKWWITRKAGDDSENRS